jgi:hypothetical protein
VLKITYRVELPVAKIQSHLNRGAKSKTAGK